MDIHTLAKNYQEELRKQAERDSSGGTTIESQMIGYFLERVEGYWKAIKKSLSIPEKIANGLSIIAAEKALSEAHEAAKRNDEATQEDLLKAFAALVIAVKTMTIGRSSLIKLHIIDLASAVDDIKRMLGQGEAQEGATEEEPS